MSSGRRSHFVHEGSRMVYEEFGSGPRVVVLIHGLLLSRQMHTPLAQALAERGHRVLTLDLLGHGESDRPRDMWRYSMPVFGEQVVGLLDHLDLPEAVVGGTSLGANVSLEVAVRAPERLRAMVVEMPVLDNALLGCAVAFTPMLIGFTVAEQPLRLVSRAASLVPRRLAHLGDSFLPDGLGLLGETMLDWVSQDPAPSGAVLQGLFFDRIAPPRSERRGIQTRALVIGHPRDPIHPFSDAGMLVDEISGAQLLEANSLLELRVTPERLTGEIAGFLDASWAGPKTRSRRGRGRSAATSRNGRAVRPAQRTAPGRRATA